MRDSDFFWHTFPLFPHFSRGSTARHKVGVGTTPRSLAHPLGCRPRCRVIEAALSLTSIQALLQFGSNDAGPGPKGHAIPHGHVALAKHLVSCSIYVMFSPWWNTTGLSLLPYPLGTRDYWMFDVIILTLCGKGFWYLKSLPWSIWLSRSVSYLDDIFPSLYYRAVIRLHFQALFYHLSDLPAFS